MNNNLAVYSGSFDPVTFGHLDIIERASRIFDRIIVAVFTNASKKHLFTQEQRVVLLREALKEKKNVEVDCFNGLLVDYVKSKNTNLIIRGLRAVSDLDYEFQVAATNRTLSPKIETIFLMPRQRYTYLSSSVVRDIASFGGDLTKLVPPHVAAAIEDIYKKQYGKTE